MPAISTTAIPDTAISLSSIATASASFGMVSIPDTDNTIIVKINRKVTANAVSWINVTDTISVSVFLSMDGGLTYPYFAGGFTANGGVYFRQAMQAESDQTISHHPIFATQMVPGRKVKVTITCVSGQINSILNVQTSFDPSLNVQQVAG